VEILLGAIATMEVKLAALADHSLEEQYRVSTTWHTSV